MWEWLFERITRLIFSRLENSEKGILYNSMTGICVSLPDALGQIARPVSGPCQLRNRNVLGVI